MAEKYNFNPDYYGVMSIEELEAFFDRVLAGESDIIPTYVNKENFWSYINYYEGVLKVATDITGVVVGDPSLTIVNMYETEGFRNYANMTKRWNDKGYIRKDIATYLLNDDNLANDLKAGGYATYWTGAIGPDVDTLARNAVGGNFEMIGAPITVPYFDANAGSVQVTAVSAISNNVDKAVMMLDIIYKDPVIYNTLLWGIEGTNYNKISDYAVEPIPNTGYGGGIIPAPTDFILGISAAAWVTQETLSLDPQIFE